VFPREDLRDRDAIEDPIANPPYLTPAAACDETEIDIAIREGRRRLGVGLEHGSCRA
jgi:hypothetical protein